MLYKIGTGKELYNETEAIVFHCCCIHFLPSPWQVRKIKYTI